MTWLRREIMRRLKMLTGLYISTFWMKWTVRAGKYTDEIKAVMESRVKHERKKEI
jgi:hypothetical protein